MATRERLTVRGLTSDLPIFHLAIGIGMMLLVVIHRPKEGDPSPTWGIAERIGQGLMPYRDFPAEYPPLGLLHVYLPRFLGGPTYEAYEVWFTIISIVVTIVTGAVVYWLAQRGWSLHSTRNTLLIFVSLVFAGLPLVIWRNDITSALFTVLALAAFAVRRDAWTGLALGLGTVTKLYPAFLGPVFFAVRLFERRWRSAAALVFGAVIVTAAVAVQLYLVAGLDAFSYILYQDERGHEIGSVGAGLALLAHVLDIYDATGAIGFGAWQVSSQALVVLEWPLRLFDAALLLTLVGTAAWRFRADVRLRGSVAPATVVAYLVATLLLVILTNKVFSPQYVVWLLPFAALMPGRQSLFLVVIVVLTTLIYPLTFQRLVHMETPSVIALNVRNLMLLVLYVWVIWPPRPVSESRDVGDPAY